MNLLLFHVVWFSSWNRNKREIISGEKCCANAFLTFQKKPLELKKIGTYFKENLENWFQHIKLHKNK